MDNVKETRHIDELRDIAEKMDDSARQEMLLRFDMKSLAKIFEDQEVCTTCLIFLGCRMNVSETARCMFMHRNTLIYRLNKVRCVTGLDVREFGDAVTFGLLYEIYVMKRGART